MIFVINQFSEAEWINAKEMRLRSFPRSECANHLVDKTLSLLPFAQPKKRLSASACIQRRAALGALFADLLNLHAQGFVGVHRIARKDLSRKTLGFTSDIFEDVRQAMCDAGLLRFSGGKLRLYGFSRASNLGGSVARFGLTLECLDQVARFGVDPHDWKGHWMVTE